MNKLEQVLNDQGRKKSWLAAELDVYPSTVTAWTQGTMPNDKNKVKIAQVLGEDVSTLFFEGGD